MRGHTIACAMLGLFAIAGTANAAEECPVRETSAQAVGAAMKNEFSCEGAFRILNLCQFGSTADNALADIVVSKCEPRFLPKALPATRASYDKARQKCQQIAVKNEGSMYQSQAAVCLARTGRDFAQKYGTKR